MGHEGNSSADGGGGNPEIAVVLLLMKRMAGQPAVVSEASHSVDRLDVDWEGTGSSDQPVQPPEPRGAPAGLQRAVAGFRDGLGCNRQPLADQMLRVLHVEWGSGTQPGGEDLRVDENGHSSRASTKTCHSSSVMSSISTDSSAPSGAMPAINSSSDGGFQKSALASSMTSWLASGSGMVRSFSPSSAGKPAEPRRG